jgi:hypothetical protein
MHIKFSSGNLNRKDRLEDLDADWSIILKTNAGGCGQDSSGYG